MTYVPTKMEATGMQYRISIHHYTNAEQSSYHIAYHKGPVQYSRLRLHTKEIVSNLSIHHLLLILNREFILKVTESCCLILPFMDY
jgi:hypothetical protein